MKIIVRKTELVETFLNLIGVPLGLKVTEHETDSEMWVVSNDREGFENDES